MLLKAEKSGSELQAHFKTHQSIEVGRIFKEFGLNKITVSSVSMAEYFINEGFEEITIAFPLNLLEIDKINLIAERVNLNITLESEISAKFAIEKIKFKTGFVIEIDTAYNRTGVWHENIKEIESIIEICKQNNLLDFKGFMTHNGHNYNTKSKNEILKNHKSSLKKMLYLKQVFNTKISLGDTPACSIIEDFTDIDILRPGNFVYNDVMQQNLGVCEYKYIATIVACPVVSIHKERNEIIIFGGAVHLSKEYILNKEGEKCFGIPVILDSTYKVNRIIENSYIKSLSQEHGIIKIEPNEIDNIKIGQIIGILPVHSCLTADLLRKDVRYEIWYLC